MVRPLPSDTIGVCPPLIITDAQIDELFDMLTAAFDDSLPELKPS